MKQGEILKRAIKLSSYSIEDVIGKTGISRGTLYTLYKEDVISDLYKEMLSKLKLDLDFSSISTKEENKNDPNMEALLMKLEMLEARLMAKDEIIKAKDETIEALRGRSGFEHKGKSKTA